VGIEIKLWQPGYGGCRYRADITKLQNYHKYLREKEREFTGIAMLFVHPNIENELVTELPSEEVSSAAYPKDGVALHWVTGWKDRGHHRWEQILPPQIQNQIGVQTFPTGGPNAGNRT
jgi:hypothetical protein